MFRKEIKTTTHFRSNALVFSMKKQLIIGLVGPIASGKGFATDKLVKLGFKKLSLSEEIREELKNSSNKTPDRKALQDLGDKMRSENGNDYWAKKVSEKIGDQQNYVIDSIRNPYEISFLKHSLNMFVLAVNCSEKTSLKRAIKRGRDIDINIKNLKLIIERDRGINQPKNGQQVEECISLSDIVIDNDGTLEEFEQKLDKLFIKLGIEKRI